MKLLSAIFASTKALHFWEGACLNFSVAAGTVLAGSVHLRPSQWVVLVIGAVGIGFKSVVSLKSEDSETSESTQKVPTSGTVETLAGEVESEAVKVVTTKIP